MALSATVANNLMDYLCRAVAPTTLTSAIKMALHTADPGTTGASEATGGSYARQAANYSAASAGACALSGTVSFTGLAAGTYTHISLWDNNATPKYLFGSALSAPQAVPGAATINITAATTSVTQS